MTNPNDDPEPRCDSWVTQPEAVPTDASVPIEYDPQTGTYWTTHDSSSRHSISTTVILAVEQVANTNPDAPATALFDAIDPDSLDGLFRSSPRRSHRNEGRVIFPLYDCEVTVYADGRIEIQPPEPA